MDDRRAVSDDERLQDLVGDAPDLGHAGGTPRG